ncbi:MULTISPECIES: DeoR/GlpR family DNA-binding transcription regulator [Staphylococcus]|nr:MULTISPECIES: DeoR/GlpR family DNA-binding transcription regulator [Staphylococcus]MDU7765121.1 DeoR/GlpR family DNA-binding transcription regulator [Staphylococcus sp.]ESR05936.1 DeoR family transcriptional regulator [Staphylococcus epidermidis CIM28]ESR22189.1 DeoR family transcriptional regulator [Staphylococcus epidermidis APO35]ESU03340.1 DeoR family transcriptional regulator [Staphylococcus epidermidis CIM37]ESV09194.1 DeoR family transcriptional regulator [Staphylococcus epidermidis 
MNKYDRLDEITKLVNKRGSVRTNEIVEDLNVSDMTVRRDLAELEEKGVLTKIHGGARSNSAFQYKEMSHQEKHTRFIEEKRFIAKNAVDLIEDGDTIFLGPGTTVQKLAEEINHYSLTIITNCLPVFNILMKKQTLHFRVYLLGGEMRDLTEAFVGEMTNQLLSQLRFSKMFFSSNGVKDGLAMTSSIEEAYTQQIALSHSLEKYLLIDSSKIGKDDFSSFCELRELNAVLTDNNDLEKKEKIESYVEVIS